MKIETFLIDILVYISVLNLAIDIVYALLERKARKLKKELNVLKAENTRLRCDLDDGTKKFIHYGDVIHSGELEPDEWFNIITNGLNSALPIIRPLNGDYCAFRSPMPGQEPIRLAYGDKVRQIEVREIPNE